MTTQPDTDTIATIRLAGDDRVELYLEDGVALCAMLPSGSVQNLGMAFPHRSAAVQAIARLYSAPGYDLQWAR